MGSSFRATAYRDGKWWTFEIPALAAPSPAGEGRRLVAMGQARTVAELPAAAKDLAAAWTGDEDVVIDIVFRVPEAVQIAIDRAGEQDTQGRAALAEASELRREAVNALRADGFTQSEVAAVLGVSRQRVQQLARS